MSFIEERRRLEDKIRDLEEQYAILSSSQTDLMNQISKLKERAENVSLEEHLQCGTYVKVVCPDCKGTGENWVGGCDIESDPPIDEGCDRCAATGHFCARQFEGKRKYSKDELKFHDIPPSRRHHVPF